MYTTNEIHTKKLSEIKILNQEEIQQLTGSKLDLKKGWKEIKKLSKNFTISDLKAEEADELLFKIISPRPKESFKESLEVMKMKENERARALALLELELLIAA